MQESLTKTLDDLNVDVIITDGGSSFLLPYLHYRAHVNALGSGLGGHVTLECSSHHHGGEGHRNRRH